jgi:hypothetical protein
MKYVLTILLPLCWAGVLRASPATDLSSPSPEIRAAAAAALRQSYQPPPESKWSPLLAALKPGDKMTNVEAILKAHGIELGEGTYGVIESRLDELWVLKYGYTEEFDQDKVIMPERHLEQHLTWKHVNAPTNFTGVWTEYWGNGQKCFETTYRDGVWGGDRTSYGSDGTKVCFEHRAPGSAEIGCTEFYPSGRIKSTGQTDNSQKRHGNWTNYNEHGSIINIRGYP